MIRTDVIITNDKTGKTGEAHHHHNHDHNQHHFSWQVGQEGLVHRVCSPHHKGPSHGTGVHAGTSSNWMGPKLNNGNYTLRSFQNTVTSWWSQNVEVSLVQAILPQLEAAESVFRSMPWSFPYKFQSTCDTCPHRYSWFVNRWPYSTKTNTSDWWEILPLQCIVPWKWCWNVDIL